MTPLANSTATEGTGLEGLIRRLGQSSSRERPGVAVIVLVLTNIWASATSFIAFALVVRDSTSVVAGKYVIATTIAQAIAVVLDAGTGQLIVREAAQSGNAEGPIAKGVRTRLFGLLITTPFVGLISGLAGFDSVEMLTCWILTVVTTIYGYALVTWQARQRFEQVAILQILNGLAFVGVALAITGGAHKIGTVEAIAIPALPLLAIGILEVARQGRLWVRHGRCAARSHGDERSFKAAVLSNAVTSHIDTLALGMFSLPAAARYSMAQRPAYGLAAISNALSTVLVPLTATAEASGHKRSLRISLRLFVLLPLVVALTLLPAAWLLRIVYGPSGNYDIVIFEILISAYFIGTTSVPVSASLLSLHEGRVIRNGAVGQMILVSTGVTVAVIRQSVLGVAISILVGRLFVAGVQSYGLHRTLRARPC